MSIDIVLRPSSHFTMNSSGTATWGSVVDQIPDEHEQHQSTDGQNQLTTHFSRLVVNIDQQPRSGTRSG